MGCAGQANSWRTHRASFVWAPGGDPGHHEPVFASLALPLLVACSEIPLGDSTVQDPGSGGGDDIVPEQVTGAWTPPEWDPGSLPAEVPVLEIEIAPEAMSRLDADPFGAPDESGTFIDSEGVHHDVALNYRGAYQLLNVMSAFDLRNWKVKFEKDDPWERRREWNFNYEPHLRQKLAYDLFRFAGVSVPGPQHVLLRVNGQEALLYLAYEDPDNASWLWDSFGDDQGDLYKAASDLPGEPVCWADLTWLGPEDADYLCHYNKKTNHKEAPEDMGVVRGFITDLEQVSDEELPGWLEEHLDVESFLSYLVVSNFIANWDSYPQRPKNYWLYEDRRAGWMVYVPWDLDATLNPYTDGTFNQMGTTAGLFYNLLENEYDSPHVEEGLERPLVRRMMMHAEYQEAYLQRYRELTELILSAGYLSDRVTALGDQLLAQASSSDGYRLVGSLASLETFIRERSGFVNQALEEEGR